jgi:hypothetical protein
MARFKSAGGVGWFGKSTYPFDKPLKCSRDWGPGARLDAKQRQKKKQRIYDQKLTHQCIIEE